MKKQFFLFLASCMWVAAAWCSPVHRLGKDTLTAADLKTYGRYLLNAKQELELISSAAHFGFSFEGRECRVFAAIESASGHNYLQFELDGIYQKRIRIEGGIDTGMTITAPSAGKHTVWIYKATEAHTGAINIKKITGRGLVPIAERKQPVIEFIGNSITCGAAADPSEVPCGTGEYHDQHNAYYAYGPRVARAIGVGFVLSSVSGIGIYRNWNSDGPAMPKVYTKTDFQEHPAGDWDFSAFTPQVVSIALGTNDFSSGDGVKTRLPFDSAVFTKAYVEFVQVVRSKYPLAKIALLSSPMVNGNSRIKLQHCLTAVKQALDALRLPGEPVSLYFFEPMKAHGCGGHPDVEDHAILAKELVPFFKTLLEKR